MVDRQDVSKSMKFKMQAQNLIEKKGNNLILQDIENQNTKTFHINVWKL